MSQETVETQQQAVHMLIQAAQLAQQRGAFNLNEASLVSQAVNHFVPPAPPPEEGTDVEEAVEEESE